MEASKKAESIIKSEQRKVRPKKMTLRLSEQEYDLIVSKSNKAKLNYNLFIVALVEQAVIEERLDSATKKLLVGLSSNLNQLTRFAHLGTISLDDIQEIIQNIKNLLAKK